MVESLTLQDFVGTTKKSATEPICTVRLGDDLRQPAYACVTCDLVVCRGCRPHHIHTIVPLGHRRFRCEQDGKRDPNIPISIRRGTFCYCHHNYSTHHDDDDKGVMWQCLGCDDWFHTACIRTDLPWITDGNDEDGDFVCRDCVKRFPFMGCQQFDNISWLLPTDWQPCRCDRCRDSFGGLFDDVLELPECEDNENDNDCDDMSQIEGTVDKASLLRTINGYHKFKTGLSAYLQSLPEGHVVTAADIHAFMAALKATE